jgi:hypothetical protein
MTRNSSQNLKNQFQECCYSLLSCYFYLFNNNSQTSLNKSEQNTTQTIVELQATLGFAQPPEIPVQISTNPKDNISLNSPNSNPRPFNIDPHIANSSRQP